MPMIRTLFVAMMLTVAIPGTARAQASACGCPDVADLRNRYCEARAAIAEYGKQIAKIRAQEARTGVPVMNSRARYKEKVQPCVQEAINQVSNPTANRPAADTDNSCTINYTRNPTACLKQILYAHESVHVTVCKGKDDERDKDGFFASLRGLVSDFREGMTLVDFLNEERAAYALEVNHVRDELARLSRSPGSPGLPAEPPGPPRIPTIEPCPPPNPRPPPEESACKFR